MYFNKLLIKDFGKFHNQELILKPGMNVLYGKKHSGKSTVGDFAYAMLYGVSKSPESEADDLRQRKPKDGRNFAGKAYLQKDGSSYLIERSFSKNNSTTQVMDIQSGRDVKLKNKNNLYQTVFETDKKTYSDVFYIHQFQEEDKQAEQLNAYVTNLATTGSSTLNAEQAVAELMKKKKKLDIGPVEAEIKQLDEDVHQFDGDEEELLKIRKQIKDTKEELAMETAKRKREARKLIDTSKQQVTEDEKNSDKTEEKTAEEIKDDTKNADDMKDLEEERIILDADLLKDYMPKKKLSEQLWFIALVGVFVVAVIAAMVYMLPFDNGVRQLFVVCTFLFVVLTIVDGLHVNGMLEGESQAPTEEEFKRIVYELERKNEAYEEVEIDMSFAKKYIDAVEDLQAAEQEIIQRVDLKNQMLEQIQACKERKRSIMREIQSINLAINTINKLTRQIAKKNDFFSNGRCGDVMDKLTGGKYMDTRIDSESRLQVKYKGQFIDINKVARQDFEMVRFAVHVAIARELCKDGMPVIIDGVPEMPEQQIIGMMECLSTIQSEQIIVLSDNQKLVDIVKKSGMDCELSDIA